MRPNNKNRSNKRRVLPIFLCTFYHRRWDYTVRDCNIYIVGFIYFIMKNKKLNLKIIINYTKNGKKIKGSIAWLRRIKDPYFQTCKKKSPEKCRFRWVLRWWIRRWWKILYINLLWMLCRQKRRMLLGKNIPSLLLQNDLLLHLDANRLVYPRPYIFDFIYNRSQRRVKSRFIYSMK